MLDAAERQITGFADTVPLIREATVKAIFPLASKAGQILSQTDCSFPIDFSTTTFCGY